MVCDGPDPPENNPHELVPPPRNEMVMNGNQGDDSDEDHEYFGYEPLAQGPEPELVVSDHDSEDDAENAETPPVDVLFIESMENFITREAWSTPRNTGDIQMDNERVQQVLRAMENFALPEDSIPEWAHSLSEEEWMQTLNERIERLKNDR